MRSFLAWRPKPKPHQDLRFYICFCRNLGGTPSPPSRSTAPRTLEHAGGTKAQLKVQGALLSRGGRGGQYPGQTSWSLQKLNNAAQQKRVYRVDGIRNPGV